MKNIHNKKINIDPIAEARKGKYFEQYSQGAKERIGLAEEIYNKREILVMSQQELAQKAQTTQKVISRIENGDVNVGFSLLNRIADVLKFNYENWGRIFNFSTPHNIFFVGGDIHNTIEAKKSIYSSTKSTSILSLNN